MVFENCGEGNVQSVISLLCDKSIYAVISGTFTDVVTLIGIQEEEARVPCNMYIEEKTMASCRL